MTSGLLIYSTVELKIITMGMGLDYLFLISSENGFITGHGLSSGDVAR